MLIFLAILNEMNVSSILFCESVPFNQIDFNKSQVEINQFFKKIFVGGRQFHKNKFHCFVKTVKIERKGKLKLL